MTNHSGNNYLNERYRQNSTGKSRKSIKIMNESFYRVSPICITISDSSAFNEASISITGIMFMERHLY